jgi:hypothetical protein
MNKKDKIEARKAIFDMHTVFIITDADHERLTLMSGFFLPLMSAIFFPLMSGCS